MLRWPVARPQYAHCDIGAYEYNGSGNPVPHITTLDPSTATAGDPGFTLTVNGSNFVINCVVKWNGSDRPTTYVNAGQLTAQISGGDIPFPGTKNVTVFNPTPGAVHPLLLLLQSPLLHPKLISISL